MESYAIEVIIKRKTSFWRSMINVLIVAVGLLFCILIQTYAGVIMWAVGPFIMIGAGAVVWWLIVQSRVEFEYSLSGGILNIDEIINERKRQHLVDIPITKIIKFGKVSDDTFKAELTRNVKIMDCSSKDNENVENMYFLIAEYENKGLCLIIFEPNIKMIIRLQSLNPIALKKIGVVE